MLDTGDRPKWTWSEAELVSFVDDRFRAAQAAFGEVICGLAELASRGTVRAHGARSEADWLVQRHRVSFGFAARMEALAKLVAEGSSASGIKEVLAGVASGEINLEQAAKISDALAKLPSDLDDDLRARAVGTMVGFAATLTPPQLEKIGKSLLTLVAPEVGEAREAAQLAAQERKALRDRYLTFRSDGNGREYLSGLLDTEGAALLKAALAPLISTRRRSRSCTDPGGQPCSDPSDQPCSDPGDQPGAPSGQSGADMGGQPSADASCGLHAEGGAAEAAEPVKRTAAQRRADALVELARLALHSDRLPAHGGQRPHLSVLVDFEKLRADAGLAVLETGEKLTAAAARRLACDALILPAVMGGESQPLDLGQVRRLFGGAVRQALILRDGGCAFPGCEAPADVCDAHHICHWCDGGRTDVDNGVLLCWFHHRVVHEGHWVILAVRGGRPWFVPPPFVDPERKPRRNEFHRRS